MTKYIYIQKNGLQPTFASFSSQRLPGGGARRGPQQVHQGLSLHHVAGASLEVSGGEFFFFFFFWGGANVL